MSGAYGPNRRPPNRRPTSGRLDPAVYRRRRLGVALVALLIVAMLVGIISLIGGGGPSGQKSTSHTTTTLTRLRPTGIGYRTVTWTDTNPSAGLVVNPAPGGSAGLRTLVTEIWYPSMGGSRNKPTTDA